MGKNKVRFVGKKNIQNFKMLYIFKSRGVGDGRPHRRHFDKHAAQVSPGSAQDWKSACPNGVLWRDAS